MSWLFHRLLLSPSRIKATSIILYHQHILPQLLRVHLIIKPRENQSTNLISLLRMKNREMIMNTGLILILVPRLIDQMAHLMDSHIILLHSRDQMARLPLLLPRGTMVLRTRDHTDHRGYDPLDTKDAVVSSIA
jgi:hypothetical protein